jgi:4,5:9,10-diseco-3-hydroxy-5,9,17-trioxoandrosta-1(10),2-diene-4-oate hydrolase
MVQRMLAPQPGAMDEARMRTMLESFVTDRSAVSDGVVAARTLVARTQPPEVLGTMRLPDLTARLGALNLPVLVIWGAADGICPVSGALKFAVGCSDATVIVYSGVGHWPMTERPETVNAAALEFLSR